MRYGASMGLNLHVASQPASQPASLKYYFACRELNTVFIRSGDSGCRKGSWWQGSCQALMSVNTDRQSVLFMKNSDWQKLRFRNEQKPPLSQIKILLIRLQQINLLIHICVTFCISTILPNLRNPVPFEKQC